MTPSIARRLLPVLLLPALLAALPARAQPYPIMDQVVLRLSAEGWVESDTARVSVGIDAALPGAEAASVRDDMNAALDRLAADAAWRFVRFDRFRDDSGLERWTATAEARLAETALDGLAARAEQASRPGLQLRVQDVDFSPTLAEIEAVQARLRSEIYARAGEELQRLNAAFPDQGYRVATIDFVNPTAMPMMDYGRAAAMPPAPMAGKAGPVAVSEKLTLNAQVVLQALTEWGSAGGGDGR